MGFIELPNDEPDFGLRAEQGGPPAPAPEGDTVAVVEAAFRQSNTFVSAMQYIRNQGQFTPQSDYNPVADLKGWKDPKYLLDHGSLFVGSQSPAETLSIKGQIDDEDSDKRLLSANGKVGFVATMAAGFFDPTNLLPGGIALDAAKGGLIFSKAAVQTGKAALLATTAQEAVLHGTQQTRTLQESAINVASGTLLTALIGGGAASLLSRGERAALETRLHADRAEMNAHAGNPSTGEIIIATDTHPEFLGLARAAEDAKKAFREVNNRWQDALEKDRTSAEAQALDGEVQAAQKAWDDAEKAANEWKWPTSPEVPQGTGQAMAAGAAGTDTRQIELVPFGLSEIPGVAKVVETTSVQQRGFGSDSVVARRAFADIGETPLLMKENLEGKPTVFGGGPAVDREARMLINQGQVAVGDELSRLFSEYRFGEERTVPRLRAGFEDLTGRSDGKMSFDEFKIAVTEAGRNGDVHENPQVQMAAQTVRNKIFEPWKKRAVEIGLLPEGVDVKTADSYMTRLYNKQAIAAQRPEFVRRVTDWLEADQAEKAQAQVRLGAYQGALDSHLSTIDKLNSKIAKLEADADVIAARQEETTRINKAANQRATKLREGADQENLPLKNAQGGAVFETLARNRGNLLADRASAKLHEIETLERQLAGEIQSSKSMREKIEKEIGAWEGKSATEAKAALKARAEAEKARQAKIDAGESKSKGERLSSADKAVDRAVRRILESDRALERQELQSRADEITNRILGSPDGRLPYDMGMEHGTAHGGSGEPPRGSLAAREFNIPDATIRDFLENDIEHIVASHMRTIVPDVLLAERFGDVKMTETFRKIDDEYAALVQAAGSEKERTRLENDRQAAIRDLAAQRDTIRGLYGLAPEGPMRNAARAVGVIKNYNVLTSMGSAALSSLPDMAGVVMRHGLVSTFNDAWTPFFKMLTSNDTTWKEAARQYRAMGIAVEMTTASRHHALTDTLDTYHPQSRVERTMQWATGKFQFVNMLAPWTDFAKVNASLVSGSEILRAAKASANGTATARQLRQLGESSIEPHMAERIAKAFDNGGEIRDGVHLPNTADWTDKAARRVFEGAVAREVDIAVITPGLEKPLWMRDQVLSVMGQFKSFTAAATERTLIANLQRRDAQVLQGLIFSMGLGMLSYKLGAVTGGTPTSDKPQDWIKEAISKGGILGWFEEGNAMASKATRGGVDIYRLIGADKPLSRFASRSAMDQILGPTAGKVAGVLKVAGAASKPSEWSESDTKAIRRLVAGQNTFYLRGLFNQVEAAGNNAFGIEMKVKPEGH